MNRKTTILLASCIATLSFSASAQCVYSAPDDPDGLVAAVTQLASRLGAPGTPEVGIQFEKDRVQVGVTAGATTVRVDWRATGSCDPPHEVLSQPPEGPGWAVELHRALPGAFEHHPTSRRIATAATGLSPLWYGLISWGGFILALLVWIHRRGPAPSRSVTPRSRWDWLVLAALAVGLYILVLRWRTGLLTDDELSYLRFPERNPAARLTLSYYLGDSGLPSLVHRALVIALYPLGGLAAISALHAILYAAYVATVRRLANDLLPASLAAAATVICVLHPRILLYFGEHRSYATFLTTAALGQLCLVRHLTTATLRSGLAATAFFGLAALDNPLCIALPLTTILVVMVVPTWRQRLPTQRLLLSAALLGVATLPALLSATGASRVVSESSPLRWWLSSAFFLLPILAFGLKRPDLAPLKAIIVGVWIVITAPMALGMLPWSAGKLELFVLPVIVAAVATALDRPIPAAVRVLLLTVWVGAFAFATKLPGEAAELDTREIQRQVTAVDNELHQRALQTPIDVFFDQPFKRVEFASYLRSPDPFTADPQALRGLSGHYRQHNGAAPSDPCAPESAYYRVMAPFALFDCANCTLEIGAFEVWHALLCQPPPTDETLTSTHPVDSVTAEGP